MISLVPGRRKQLRTAISNEENYSLDFQDHRSKFTTLRMTIVIYICFTKIIHFHFWSKLEESSIKTSSILHTIRVDENTLESHFSLCMYVSFKREVDKQLVPHIFCSTVFWYLESVLIPKSFVDRLSKNF